MQNIFLTFKNLFVVFIVPCHFILFVNPQASVAGLYSAAENSDSFFSEKHAKTLHIKRIGFLYYQD